MRLGDITVEGELGTVSGVEDQVRVAETEAELCDPARSREYVERSGVDLFAPAIGTAHGVYLTENPKIDFDRFAKIQEMVNGRGIIAPLIVHGGTGLKPEVVRRLVALGWREVQRIDRPEARLDRRHLRLHLVAPNGIQSRQDRHRRQAGGDRAGQLLDRPARL